MTALSNYAENKILDFVLRNQAFSMPTLYLALFTGDPAEDGSGPELADGGYARVQIDFDAFAAGACANQYVEFPTATENWTEVTHVALFDAASSGNMIAKAVLGDPVSILDDTKMVVDAGALTLSMDMTGISDYLAEALTNHLAGVSAYTQPATVYVSLHETSPAADDSGTELSGDGYARKAVTFSAAVSGAIVNSADVEFDTPAAEWAQATALGIYDASSAGNLLFFDNALAVNRTGDPDNIPYIAAGDLSVTVD